MPLTDTKLRSAKPKAKPYRLADAGGLYLEVTPAGGRYWRWKYRYGGKEKRLALGVYPDVSLIDARAKRDAARKTLAAGTDPGEARKEAKRKAAAALENSFEAVARDWHKKQARTWSTGHASKVMEQMELHLFPTLGAKPLEAITARNLLDVLEKVGESTPYTAKRLCQYSDQVFRMALIDGRADNNPAASLSRALHTHKETNYAALTASELPTFLRRLATDTRGSSVVRMGLRLLALTFVRPGELRNARWSEFDLDGATWEIPAERMKMREAHIVPLPAQAVETLRALKELTGFGDLLFPSRVNSLRPISDNTFRKALHDMGFEVTAHGFRATASTILNEMGFRADVIERQLSHGERNKVRKAYNRAQYLEERRDMMRQWGDYLAALEVGGKVVPINQRKGTHA
ncbi:MAG: tyrosine-type recombinase/integrase [Gammaproteobacteria bacterium]